MSLETITLSLGTSIDPRNTCFDVNNFGNKDDLSKEGFCGHTSGGKICLFVSKVWRFNLANTPYAATLFFRSSICCFGSSIYPPSQKHALRVRSILFLSSSLFLSLSLSLSLSLVQRKQHTYSLSFAASGYIVAGHVARF